MQDLIRKNRKNWIFAEIGKLFKACSLCEFNDFKCVIVFQAVCFILFLFRLQISVLLNYQEFQDSASAFQQ